MALLGTGCGRTVKLCFFMLFKALILYSIEGTIGISFKVDKGLSTLNGLIDYERRVVLVSAEYYYSSFFSKIAVVTLGLLIPILRPPVLIVHYTCKGVNCSISDLLSSSGIVSLIETGLRLPRDDYKKSSSVSLSSARPRPRPPTRGLSSIKL